MIEGFLRLLFAEKLYMSSETLCLLADQQGYNLRADSYRVLAIASTHSIDSQEAYQTYCCLLPKLCASLFQREPQIVQMDCDQGGRCILLVMDYSYKRITEQIVKPLIRLLDKNKCVKTVIGIGKEVTALSEIAASYHAAIHTLNSSELSSSERCLFYEDLQAIQNRSTIQSLIDLDKALQLFRRGDIENLRQMVTLYAEKVRALSDAKKIGRQPTSIRRMFVELTVYVLHIASDMGVDVDAILDGIDPYNFLLAKGKSTPEIIDWFIAMCVSLRKAMDEKSQYMELSIVQRVCTYIEEQITKSDLNLEEAACVVNMTPAYLSRLFRKEMGIGFVKYIAQRRMAIANELLKKTNIPIRDVAARVGYASANYFGVAFKKATGVSPQVYRESNRPAD